MSQQWVVERDGRRDGPFTSNQLRERAADGRLRPTDRVSPDGQRWSTADRVKGLRFPPPPGPTAVTVVLPAEPNVGAVAVPGYEVLSILGAGGCGVVYRARQLRLGREVALKTVNLHRTPDGTEFARFEQEAVALAKLQHPNIVNVFDYGRHDGRVYMAMELLDGEDLDRRIERAGPLDERTAWAIARQTAAALAHAESVGITHRDVKPANLFLVPAPTGFGLPPDVPMVKVTDFGLAFTKRADLSDGDSRLTRAGVVLGTPAYMAPEQFARSDVDHRADIYALGATVYHSLAGKIPFDGDTVWDVMTKKNVARPRLDAPASAESARLVADMLAPDPAHRVGDYAELIRRIDALGLKTGSFPVAPRRRWRPSRAGVAVAAGATVLAVGLLATAALTESGPGLVSGPAPAVATAGNHEVLSDRGNADTWVKDGMFKYVDDEDGTPTIHTAGAVRWTYRPTEAYKLSLGLDPYKAEAVDVIVSNGPAEPGGVGVRVTRLDGVTAGLFEPDGKTFRPLTPAVKFPPKKEGVVPYLSVELQRVGDRWDVWFDHEPLGGVRAAGVAGGQVQVRTDGREVRVDHVELERLKPAG